MSVNGGRYRSPVQRQRSLTDDLALVRHQFVHLLECRVHLRELLVNVQDVFLAPDQV